MPVCKLLRFNLSTTGIYYGLVLCLYGGILRRETSVDGAVKSAAKRFASTLFKVLAQVYHDTV
jgi:hypothetical protein